jgi:uncharacterized membrane protein YfcA
LLTPLLIFSMPTPDAVGILTIPHAWATGIRWLRLRADVHVPTFRQFGIASAAGGLTGALLQSRLGSPVLSIVLATLLVMAGTANGLRTVGRRCSRARLPVPGGFRHRRYAGYHRLLGALPLIPGTSLLVTVNGPGGR